MSALKHHKTQARCPMSGLPETYVLSDKNDIAALHRIAADGGCDVYVSKDPGNAEDGWVLIRNLRISEDGKLCGDLTK